MKAWTWMVGLAAMACSPAIAQTSGPDAEGRGTVDLRDIEARLLYELSGTLSDDITAIEGFAGWNTLIGEGSAKEPATDILIIVRLVGGGQIYDERTLSIRALDSDRNTLAERTMRGVSVDRTGHAFLLLKEATCEGEITLEATLGDQKVSEKIDLYCGE